MSARKELNYDMVILGGGPAGLSAAIYAARGTLKTAIVDISMIGGQPTNYLEIENYPGFSMSGGFELMEKFEEHADKFNAEKFPMEEILRVDLLSKIKKIETSNHVFNAKTVVIATGAHSTKLNVPGEKEFAGRGVSYCAVCDGAFFRDKEVCVVGGGNAAVEEAIYLTKFASKVNIIHRRDKLRAEKIIQERAFKNPKINFIWNAVIEEIQGENSVEKIIVKDVNTKKTYEMATQGVFPYIGFSPNSQLFNTQLKMDQTGFILTDVNLETSVKGVYAAGDVRVTPLRQVITSAADGAIAATAAIKHLEEVEAEITA